MRRVFKFERLWLREVRYQLSFYLREKFIKRWMLYVKYKKTRKMWAANRAAAFFLQLAKLVGERRLETANLWAYRD